MPLGWVSGRDRRRRGKRKESAGFPPTDDVSTDIIHQIEKQSLSMRRQLCVGAKGGGFTEAPRGRFPPTPVHFTPRGHVGA